MRSAEDRMWSAEDRTKSARYGERTVRLRVSLHPMCSSGLTCFSAGVSQRAPGRPRQLSLPPSHTWLLQG